MQDVNKRGEGGKSEKNKRGSTFIRYMMILESEGVVDKEDIKLDKTHT